ncbi:hypothetical protein SAMN05421676_10399 [Salinibacillus kushneri]|uniref:Uncharacterized protein n=1 Tax=Salinibacillus kushneri TaxID=237682 RepID=A0A1I0CC81_9BACI|nr:hypothetical protein SAMN05421676_10399 [Salinibacillus kushneri]
MSLIGPMKDNKKEKGHLNVLHKLYERQKEGESLRNVFHTMK